MSINPKLEKFIATRDNRIMKANPYQVCPPLQEHFSELLKRGTLRVGGRATCGTSTDPSWRIFTAWNEVVKKANTLGYQITVTKVKVGNSWTTKAGGFWEENDYSISPLAAGVQP